MPSMGVYDDILVPTDGSNATSRAVDHAVELAAFHDATLHALYVVNTATFARNAGASSAKWTI